MKLEITELELVKQSIENATFIGKDAFRIAALLKKIYKEIDKEKKK